MFNFSPHGSLSAAIMAESTEMQTAENNQIVLSHRELQILELLAQGRNQQQVAAMIYVSPHTVNFHVRNILHKLTARNITAAVAYAIVLKLIKVATPALSRSRQADINIPSLARPASG